MAVSVSCPECGKALKAPEEMAGKRVRCPGCQHAFRLPAAAAAEDFDIRERTAAPDDEFPDLSDVLGRTTEMPPDGDELAEFPALRSRTPSAPGESFVRPHVARPRVGQKLTSIPANPPKTKQPARFQVTGAWLVLILFLPLAISILLPGRDPEELLEELLRDHPEIEERISAATSKAEFLAALPEGRFPGAHLSHDSLGHWIYASISLLVYWGMLGVVWREKTAGPGTLLITGVVTGTLGILLLLAFQFLAMLTQGVMIWGRGIGALIFLVIKFIGYSYACAEDPESSLVGSFMGFTCGVGLCEELIKALPIVVYLNSGQKTTWRGACLMGLATGIGFGVSEGIHYSAEYYNGIATGLTYAVRFCSCVALHAIWSSAVALLMYNNQDWLQEFSWESSAMFVVNYLLIAMLLHGLYDTLLKKHFEIGALLVAFASFGWWLWIISSHAQKSRRKSAAAG
ncbi:MAG: PrsW family glutamic-type intramembrane protease [Planctomycetaceae bacterium]|nr:PrsW family glutamic-type intramembrane protease [Planctomycetaceae bacterium]